MGAVRAQCSRCDRDHKHLAYKSEVFILCSLRKENVLAFSIERCVGVKHGLPECVCFHEMNMTYSEIQALSKQC